MKRLLDCSVTWLSISSLGGGFRIVRTLQTLERWSPTDSHGQAGVASVGSDPARLSKKHLLLPGLHDSPHSTTPQLLSPPTSELATSDHYWSGELEQRTRYPWYGPHEPFLLISQ